MRVLTALLLTAGLACSQEFPVGSKVDVINVTDHGSAVSINPAKAKATAVVFVSVQCPVSNAYNERMNAIYKDYTSKGVQFAFVNANSSEDVRAVDAHAKEHNFAFKVLKDENNVLADKLNAQFTPEVFVFDGTNKLVYHGRFDDSRDLDRVKSKDFRAALDATLAGTPIAVSNTRAFGCTIKRRS